MENIKISNSDYKKLVEKSSKNSPLIKNMICAFFYGGAFCVVGEFSMTYFEGVFEDEKLIAAANAVFMVGLGVLLTALGLYEKLAKRAGAGTIIPITGFANSVASSAIEFKSEGFILGMGAKMFAVAAPVIVYGTVASVIYGLILFLWG